MNAICDYIYTVFVVCIAGGLLLQLSPQSQNNGLQKAYRYLVSLSVVISLIAPLQSFSGAFKDISHAGRNFSEETSPISNETNLVVVTAVSKIEKELTNMIQEEYGITPDISLITHEENGGIIYINEITVNFPENISEIKKSEIL